MAEAVGLWHAALVTLLRAGERSENVRFVGAVELLADELAVVRPKHRFGSFPEPIEKCLIGKTSDQIGIPVSDRSRHRVENPFDKRRLGRCWRLRKPLTLVHRSGGNFANHEVPSVSHRPTGCGT